MRLPPYNPNNINVRRVGSPEGGRKDEAQPTGGNTWTRAAQVVARTALNPLVQARESAGVVLRDLSELSDHLF